MLAAPLAQSRPARTLAVLGVACELGAFQRLRRSTGMAAETYSEGRAGRLVRASEVLSAAGTAGAVLGHRSRAVTALSGAALLAASALTRFGIFHAGMRSARDPRYTVEPQRRRLDGPGVDGHGPHAARDRAGR
jgi:hypothetical protein